MRDSVLDALCERLALLATHPPGPEDIRSVLRMVEAAQSYCWMSQRTAAVNQLALVQASLLAATKDEEQSLDYTRRAREYAATLQTEFMNG